MICVAGFKVIVSVGAVTPVQVVPRTQISAWDASLNLLLSSPSSVVWTPFFFILCVSDLKFDV